LSRDKDFLTGGEKRGCWFAIGKPTQIDGKTVVVICEGYATGASIHIATELGVVIAFDAGNLLPVAETVRNLMKDSVIIIAADDDQWTEQPIKNPGVTRAREAADKIGGLVAKPLFKSLDGKPTDFNDLHTRDGSEMVKAQILAVLKPAPKVEPAPKPAGLPKAEKVKPDLTKSDEPKPGSDKADIPSNVDPSRHFTILGYDREHIYVYQHKKKMITARGEAAWDKKALISIADLSWWELNFHGDKGLNIDMAMNWLVRKAQDKGYYDPSLTRGRGAWEDEKRDIYHFGNMLWVNNVATPVEKIESKYVYEQSRHLLAPHDVALTNEEGKRIVELAKRFRWGRNASAVLLAGWCALAPICGALRWRPHIWITGGPGSGKSTILEHFVYLLTNGIALYAQGNSTEAGLRQILKTDALPVIFDEAEQNNDKERARMQGAISLIRQSSSESGAKTFKGTTHGQAMDFMIRSSFCLASIQVGIEHQADQERIAVLRLRPKRDADDAAGEWIKLRDDLHGMRRDRAMAAKLLRRALELRQITLRNVEVFATAAAGRFGSQRHGDQYGTLMAGAWSLVSEKLVTAVEAERVIDQYEWKEYLESSETEASEKALDVLRTAHISLPHGRTITVFDLVCLAAGRQSLGSHAPDSHEANEALSLYGLRVHAWNKTPEGLKKDLVDKLRKRNVVFHPTNLDFIALFKSSPFATNPASCLRDVSFSSGKANARIGGASKPCYCIPLDKFLGEDDVSNKSDVATDVAKQRDWGELEDAY
jgi:putative DNA primase/helicase